MNGSENFKLLELRSKTDRQLFELVRNRLENGLMLAAQPDKNLRMQAERARSDAGALLPLIRAAAPQRRSLELKFHLLGRMLCESPAETHACAACSQIPA
jgi:hypothetical protein